MKAIRKGLCALAVMPALAGCAYNVQPASVRAINIYTSYDDKIPGKWIIVMDDSVRNIQREITASSHVCSAHKYPIVVGDSLALGIKSTFEQLVEEVVEAKTVPSMSQLRSEGARGYAVVRLDDFQTRLSCSMGFMAGHCSATTDVGLGLKAETVSGDRLGTGAVGTRTTDGDSGGACEGAAQVVANSFERAARDALERLAERVANAGKLRPAEKGSR